MKSWDGTEAGGLEAETGQAVDWHEVALLYERLEQLTLPAWRRQLTRLYAEQMAGLA